MSFNKYLDTVYASSSPPPGSNKQSQSPWLFLDAADTIFATAKRRVYSGKVTGQTASRTDDLPDSVQPVLEELPKWALLAEILQEIETDMYFNPQPQDQSNATILIMCGDQSTCRQIREYLASMHFGHNDAEDDKDEEEDVQPSGRFMMRRKLRGYLAWKRDFDIVRNNLFAENQSHIKGVVNYAAQNASRGRGAPSNKRRRIRGGAAAAAMPQRTASGSIRIAGDRDAHMAALMADLAPTDAEALQKPEIGMDNLEDMEDHYELYDTSELIVVHPYDGDMDEHVLAELKPRYVVMYEPDAAFIRRVEVYRSSHGDRNVRVYFMYYGDSVEERRYLDAVRKEKDAFTKLIRERGVSRSRVPR